MNTSSPQIITLDLVTNEYEQPADQQPEPIPSYNTLIFELSSIPPLSTPQQKEQARAKLQAYLSLSKSFHQ